MIQSKGHPWAKRNGGENLRRKCNECRRDAREGSLKCGYHDGLLNGMSDGKYYHTRGKYKEQ